MNRLPSPAPRTPILTPCIGVCCLDDNGYCTGCLRNADEISAWRDMDDTTRLHVMRDVLPHRQPTP